MQQRPIYHNHIEDYFNALRIHQNKNIGTNDVLKEPINIARGPKVTVQCKSGGPWTLCTVS